ncbi:DUF6683 family protein [Nostoc sp. TCL26-01]|uniref:DUF6683 family protein n=1 Tax=Nostoc sp. TCL26-01 TaxID=2576904 RepID=UPI0015B82FEB|nr:DUF6683 family protein [Nostoc sp. TCL26-01]QLE54665.1 hypothetical protein FD725_03540 [Nostoc sp. TCL26-01]
MWIAIAISTIPVATLAQGVDSFSDSALLRNGDFYSNLFHQKFLNRLVDPLKSRRGNRLVRRETTTVSPSKVPATQTSTITVPQPNGATMPKKLAQSAPEAQRQTVEKVFSQLLARYPKLEEQFNIPANDLAGAMAAFVILNYETYQGTQLNSSQVEVVVKQMRTAISTSPQFQTATAVQKRELYEQMAILGMYVGGLNLALKQTPNPQIAIRLKTASKGYLETLLQTSVDRISIKKNGLEIQ